MNEGALDQDRRAAYPNFLAHGRSSNAMSNIQTDVECGPIQRKRVLNCSQLRGRAIRASPVLLQAGRAATSYNNALFLLPFCHERSRPLETERYRCRRH